MHRLWRDAAAEAGRLLRVLFLRLGAVPADSGGAFGRDRRRLVLHGVARRGQRYGPQLTRLAAQPPHQPVGMVDSSDRHCRRALRPRTCSDRDLDCRARVDGDGLHSQCKAMRTHSLPLHGAVLSRHDRARAGACFGYRVRRFLWMAYIGCSHSCRKQGHLVGYRASMGEVFLGSSDTCSSAGRECATKILKSAYHVPQRVHLRYVAMTFLVLVVLYFLPFARGCAREGRSGLRQLRVDLKGLRHPSFCCGRETASVLLIDAASGRRDKV
jgi:hypothetical protein